MTTDAADPTAPLAGMRGRLSAVPRPPRVVMPNPVPASNDAGASSPAPSSRSSEAKDLRPTLTAQDGTGDAPTPGSGSQHPGAPGPTSQPDEPKAALHDAPLSSPTGAAAQDLLSAAANRGFNRVVRDLYDDQQWDDGLNMTWALPRAVRDTVARFGVDAGLANKRAATAVMYLGLLQLGLEVRPNTPDEERTSRRRT